MKITSIENQFVFVPNRRNTGTSVFEGSFSASEEVENIIKDKGIDYISNKILSIIESRKEMYGNASVDFYGLHPSQKFYDLKNRIMLQVKDLILPENNIIEINKVWSPKSLNSMSRTKAHKIITSGINYFHYPND